MPPIRNPLTGRRRRRGSRNLSRKRRAQRLDVNKRDFLVTTVHPLIKHWSGRVETELTFLFMLFLFHPRSVNYDRYRSDDDDSTDATDEDDAEEALQTAFNQEILKTFFDVSVHFM